MQVGLRMHRQKGSNPLRLVGRETIQLDVHLAWRGRVPMMRSRKGENPRFCGTARCPPDGAALHIEGGIERERAAPVKLEAVALSTAERER